LGQNNERELYHGDEISLAAPNTDFESELATMLQSNFHKAIEVISFIYRNDPKSLASPSKVSPQNKERLLQEFKKEKVQICSSI
jgi:late competence protein required for DNA uptake (superfamily II DNA/RNA helicase)